MRTPADLKAARLRLGLSHREVAQLIGWPPEGDVSQMERAKSNVCWQGYADALRRMEKDMDVSYSILEKLAEHYGVIVFYSSVEDLEHFPAPPTYWAWRTRVLPTIVRTAALSLQHHTDLPLIEFNRSLYERWLPGQRHPHAYSWAQHRLTEIEQRPGLPPLKLVRRPA